MKKAMEEKERRAGEWALQELAHEELGARCDIEVRERGRVQSVSAGGIRTGRY
jgi:hypothetical protein